MTDTAHASAALAPTLAGVTREQDASIGAVCRDALHRMDCQQDELMQARLPGLQALAGQVRASRGSLAQIRDELERFHLQLHTASEHIGKLQDRSNALSEHLASQESNASTLTDWIEVAVIPPSTVRLLRDTNVEHDLGAWVKAVHTIERTMHALGEYEASQNGAPPPSSARAQAHAVAEQCKNLVRAIQTNSGYFENLPVPEAAL